MGNVFISASSPNKELVEKNVKKWRDQGHSARMGRGKTKKGNYYWWYIVYRKPKAKR